MLLDQILKLWRYEPVGEVCRAGDEVSVRLEYPDEIMVKNKILGFKKQILYRLKEH